MEPSGIKAEENEKPDISFEKKPEKPHDAKAIAIQEACKWKDIEALRDLATSERGLVSDELRRQACS
jgi:hypothetical protein